ncbi:MAG TPA: Ig-like domain-containing protein [Actinomycetota bacterium]|nr:Ig-like domain-containing protein [Actinomycetota bacterium]
MKLSRRSIALLAIFAMAATCVLFLAAGSALASTPAWEPDPNAAAPYGTITFYDSAGNVVTSGSDLHHIADYAAASTGPDANATKANLLFARPDHTQSSTSLWTTGSASASTVFPNSSAPAPIQGPGFTNPVVTLGSTDGDIASFIQGITPDNTAGYANIFQVRLKDSGPLGAGSGSHYWTADIMVDTVGGTWQEVYPTVGTTTTLSVSPTGSQYSGLTTTLSATETPATPGSVQFKDGVTDLGSPVAVDGSGLATLDTSSLSVGAHSLSAVFTPTDTTAFVGSTSNTVSYTIIGKPTWQPYLYGSHKIGLTDSCLASFANATSVTYTWYQEGSPIAGATASTYKIAEGYYGKHITCAVDASNPGNAGDETGTSLAYIAGTGPALVATGKPYLYNGTNKTTAPHGRYEYVNHGTWSPSATSYTYQWYVGTTRITGATSYRFIPPSSYVGKYIYCIVTALRLHWTNGSYKTAGVKVT